MRWKTLAVAALAFGCGLGAGAYSRPDRGAAAAGLRVDPSGPVRVIHPGEDGRPRSVPLRVTRVTREPSTAGDDGQAWTFVFGDPTDAVWVYAAPVTP